MRGRPKSTRGINITIRTSTELKAALESLNAASAGKYGRKPSMNHTIAEVIERGLGGRTPPVWRKCKDGESWVFGEREAFVFRGSLTWQYVGVHKEGRVVRSLGFDDAEAAMVAAETALIVWPTATKT